MLIVSFLLIALYVFYTYSGVTAMTGGDQALGIHRAPKSVTRDRTGVAEGRPTKHLTPKRDQASWQADQIACIRSSSSWLIRLGSRNLCLYCIRSNRNTKPII